MKKNNKTKNENEIEALEHFKNRNKESNSKSKVTLHKNVDYNDNCSIFTHSSISDERKKLRKQNSFSSFSSDFENNGNNRNKNDDNSNDNNDNNDNNSTTVRNMNINKHESNNENENENGNGKKLNFLEEISNENIITKKTAKFFNQISYDADCDEKITRKNRKKELIELDENNRLVGVDCINSSEEEKNGKKVISNQILFFTQNEFENGDKSKNKNIKNSETFYFIPSKLQKIKARKRLNSYIFIKEKIKKRKLEAYA